MFRIFKRFIWIIILALFVFDTGVEAYLFSVDKILKDRLLNSGTEANDNAYQEILKVYQKKAIDSKNVDVNACARYLLLAPNAEKKQVIFDKIFIDIDKKYSFKFAATFVLFDEYKERYPDGKLLSALTPEKLFTNELTHLKAIYLSKPIKQSVENTIKRGIAEDKLLPLIKLQKEVLSFEELNGKDTDKLKYFIIQFPESERVEILRQILFDRIGDDFYKKQTPELISEAISVVSAEKARNFYSKIWDNLYKKAQNKSPSEQLEIIRPWLLKTEYRFQTLSEELFLIDILSWAASLHSKMGNAGTGAMSNLTASAIIHAGFKTAKKNKEPDPDKQKILNKKKSDLNDIFKVMQDVQKSVQKAVKRSNNLIRGRSLLKTMGGISFFMGSSDLFEEINKLRSMSDKEKQNSLKSIEKKAEDVIHKKDEYHEVLTIQLINILQYDPDNWPALGVLTIFPDPRPLSQIILMPRFYDYEQSIEKYLDKFPIEAEKLATKWLDDPDTDSFKKARAFFVLGYLKKKHLSPKDEDKLDLNKYQYFYDYYKLCTSQKNRPNHLKNMVNAVVKEDRVALVLYSRVTDQTSVPSEIKAWIVKEIKKEKFRESETVHIFFPIIDRLHSLQKNDLIELMFNSYSLSWLNAGSNYYIDSLPKQISPEDFNSVMDGNNPFKKISMIKALAKNKDNRFHDQITTFLSGDSFKQNDRLLVRSLMKKMVKDNPRFIFVTDKNRLVSQAMEPLISSLISDAAIGLDLLPFDQAVQVINKYWLQDETLCVKGARWILKNFDPKIHSNPNIALEGKRTKSVCKAVLSLLNSRFSNKPDYKEFWDIADGLKNNEKWVDLILLGFNYARKEEQNQKKALRHITNPVPDQYYNNLISNLNNRVLKLLSRYKPTSD